MLFSIIMPAYNAGRFLEKSIRSILSQTFPAWELILINDGSVDNTDSIARHYANQDHRIRYFFQSNMGVSQTRNRGIELAKGDYILFVDADDELSLNALEAVRCALKSDVCDIVVFNAYRCDTNSTVIGKVTTPFSKQALYISNEYEKRLHIYTALASNQVFGVIWNFAVKRELLADIRFLTDMVMYEDLLFDIQMYERANKIVCIPNYLYYYRDNPSGCVRNFNYHKIGNLKVAYKTKCDLAKKYGIQNCPATLNVWFCATILEYYMSILENRILCMEFLAQIKQDPFIMEKFAQLQNPSQKKFKLLLGNRFEQFVLRYYFLLRRSVKKVLHH